MDVRDVVRGATLAWLTAQEQAGFVWQDKYQRWHVPECRDCGEEKRYLGRCENCRREEIDAQLADIQTEDLERELRRRLEAIEKLRRDLDGEAVRRRAEIERVIRGARRTH
jgi:primosomal protein N'